MASHRVRIHQVDFWFDPVCPYSWTASRWLLEVERSRPLDIRWHVMSLYLLNERRTEDPSYITYLAEVSGVAKVASAAAAAHGQAVLRDLYAGFGTRIFDEWRYASADECRSAIVGALADAGLPTALAKAFDSDGFSPLLRDSHETAVALVGDECGTPVTRIDGHACYGPILNSIPRGEMAERVFDGAQLLAGVPDFYELKRTRTTAPVFS
ncbi:DsbA family protein [Intrasporangium sp. DVR]|uniref:DsbA family protein n=1 Tax=Intrasporangium sp. DVR TaxID=3127867 RepID=UPI00313A7105